MSTWEIEGMRPNGEPGTIRVSRADDGIVTVAWFCGGGRSFTPELLRARIEQLHLAVELNGDGDVALQARDQNRAAFWCRVDPEGQFHGDENNTLTRGSVPWDELHAALKKALRKPSAKKS